MPSHYAAAGNRGGFFSFGIISSAADRSPPHNNDIRGVDKMTDMSLSRREMLAGVSAAAAVLGGALPVPALAKAPMLNTQAPAFYRFKVGAIEATVVSDGPMAIGAPEKTFLGPTPAELGRMLTDHFLPADNVVLDQNALVLNTGDKLVLFETGMSSVKRNNDMGRLTLNLKAAGIDPKDIDYVIPSHTHIDHIGGIFAADGSENFPNAQIFVAQSDFDYWTSDARIGTPGEGSMRAAKKNLLPIRDRVFFYNDGKDVIPGVQAMHTPGHTVGHTCFVVSSGGKTLYVGGDLVHHEIIVEKPRMEDFYDTDRPLGIQTRLKTMDMLAAQRLLSVVYHLPWPGLGHFTKRGDGFHFEPEPMQVVL
jgi:glyoxylase-like metal-dependent hydrolase (beta-lactamase superfamily II)